MVFSRPHPQCSPSIIKMSFHFLAILHASGLFLTLKWSPEYVENYSIKKAKSNLISLTCWYDTNRHLYPLEKATAASGTLPFVSAPHVSLSSGSEGAQGRCRHDFTMLLAQAIRWPLHFTLLMFPSPSCRMQDFHRLIQDRSNSSNWRQI